MTGQLDINIIHWVCYAPSPYNNQLFRALSEKLPIRVQFYFTKAASEFHFWEDSPCIGFASRCYCRRFGVDWRLVRWVCRDPQSLFVTNCWQDPTSQIILLFLILANRPYLVWNDTPSLHRKRNFVKRYLRQLFLQIVFRRAFAVMGTGRVALFVLARLGCPSEKLVNFPYFIDIDEFSPPEERVTNQPILFGSCGRLHHDKGYDLSLRALADAFHGRPTGFRYQLAGTGPEISALKQLAQSLGIANQVDFLGWLRPEDLPQFYRSIDVFVHPARTEPFGVSVLEAMASGAIVIASDQTSAAVDRIVTGENGFLHTSENVNNLSIRITDAIGLSATEKNRLKHAARETAKLWSTRRAVGIISQLLRDVQPDRAERSDRGYDRRLSDTTGLE